MGKLTNSPFTINKNKNKKAIVDVYAHSLICIVARSRGSLLGLL